MSPACMAQLLGLAMFFSTSAFAAATIGTAAQSSASVPSINDLRALFMLPPGWPLPSRNVDDRRVRVCVRVERVEAMCGQCRALFAHCQFEQYIPCRRHVPLPTTLALLRAYHWPSLTALHEWMLHCVKTIPPSQSARGSGGAFRAAQSLARRGSGIARIGATLVAAFGLTSPAPGAAP